MGRVRTMSTALALLGCVLVPSAASAQARCRISDPTGTPLNIRAEPNGAVIGQIGNGTLVIRDGDTRDDRGRVWTYIRGYDTNLGLGWVFREFVSCF